MKRTAVYAHSVGGYVGQIGGDYRPEAQQLFD
jgi:hypothetical protein